MCFNNNNNSDKYYLIDNKLKDFVNIKNLSGFDMLHYKDGDIFGFTGIFLCDNTTDNISWFYDMSDLPYLDTYLDSNFLKAIKDKEELVNMGFGINYYKLLNDKIFFNFLFKKYFMLFFLNIYNLCNLFMLIEIKKAEDLVVLKRYLADVYFAKRYVEDDILYRELKFEIDSEKEEYINFFKSSDSTEAKELKKEEDLLRKKKDRELFLLRNFMKQSAGIDYSYDFSSLNDSALYLKIGYFKRFINIIKFFFRNIYNILKQILDFFLDINRVYRRYEYTKKKKFLKFFKAVLKD
jgi:hypothetical protein